MLRINELRLPLDHDAAALRRAALATLGVDDAAVAELQVFKRGVDARSKRAVVLTYTLDIRLAPGVDEAAVLARHAGNARIRPSPDTRYQLVGQAPAGFFSPTDRGSPSTPNSPDCPQSPQSPNSPTATDTPTRPAALGQARGGRLRPVVVGFGPCGIFAALVLAQMGLRPIVLERGKKVRERTKDTWGLWRQGVLNPESNVQFGEGGAGTFSDGKLYSQISDPRHLTRKVLSEFVKAGAPEEILYVSKPHIGTFRLVGVVEKMRAEIEALGGEVRFGQRVTDLIVSSQPDGSGRQVRGLQLADGSQLDAEQVVLAVGHSARDTFAVLHQRGVQMEAKPFAVGFRIEHPQSLIDRARLGPNAGHPILGAADYKLVHHASNGRAVYSFCMCPGGTVVAATSEPGRVVTNGMSQYSRNERNANAGIVVAISPQDYRQDGRSAGPVSPLDGIAFQRFWESRAFELGGENYQAPGQLVGDFVAGRQGAAISRQLGSVMPSYTPGVTLTDLNEPGRPSLPPAVLAAVREGLPAFERQIKGFAMADAVLTGVETRTSSPLRISRGPDHQSLNTAGLYPAGEGAGYAGGIMSAGVDGIEVAESLGRHLLAQAAA